MTFDTSTMFFGRRQFLVSIGAAALLAACAASDATGDQVVGTTPGTTGTTPGTTPGTVPRTTAEPVTTLETPVLDTVPAPASTAASTAASAFTAADFEALGTCALLPEKTAGPYPLDEQFDRRDITEGYPGHPLRLGLRVIDGRCVPIAGAVVELWHADATGDYSAFTDGGGGKDEGAGTTFLRGSQTAGADGIVEFLTVYPGWYRGRAVHIHLRVHLADGSGERTVLTSQMFFDEAYTAAVYASDPYAENGLPDTPNAADRIAGDPAGEGTLLVPVAGETGRGAGSVALLNLGVDPT
jgi:protocatechuate 3,4-dioxygenase beta subunit